MTKVIGVIAKKGGAGKTTLTSLIANKLFKEGDEFLAIDLDHDQKSLYNQRQRDLQQGTKEENVYDLITTDSTKFTKLFVNAIEGDFKYVVIDIPGSFEQEGIRESLAFVDIAILPTFYDVKDFQAFIQTLNFLSEIDKLRVERGFEPIRKRALFNRVNKIDNDYKSVVKGKEALSEKYGVEFFKQDIAASKIVANSFSTVELSSRINEREDALAFINEAYELIKEK